MLALDWCNPANRFPQDAASRLGWGEDDRRITHTICEERSAEEGMNSFRRQRYVCLADVLGTCLVVWVTVVMWRWADDSGFTPLSLLRFGLAAFVLGYCIRVIVKTWYSGASRSESKQPSKDRKDC
jgi:hypothetical protein